MENVEFLSKVEAEKEVKNITEKKEVKAIKSRTFNIMQYEEFLNEEKIKSVVSSYKTIKRYAYIKHNKDLGENLAIKKPHFHIVLQFDQLMPHTTIAKWLGIKPNFVEVPKGAKAFIQCVQYLTHESDAQQKLKKHLYSDDEVFANFNFREELDLYKSKNLLSGGKNKKLELREQVLKHGLPLSSVELNDYVADMSALQLCRKEYLRNYAELPKFRVNYFIRGGSGVGKSFSSRALAKSLVDPYNTMSDNQVFFVTGQGNAMFQGYDGQPVIIYDDVRSWDLINYYNKNAGAIFNLFDIVPTSSEQNIKFGSIKLINSFNIVNSIQTFEEFSEEICYRVKESGLPEPDKQMYRRFPFIFNVKHEVYDFFVNKQFFDPNESNYKTYKQFENLGVSMGLINAKKQYGDSDKFVELRQRHFETPILEHKKVEEKFKQQEKTEEEKQVEFDFIMSETNKKIIVVSDYEMGDNLTEQQKKQMEIEDLKTRLRELTGF